MCFPTCVCAKTSDLDCWEKKKKKENPRPAIFVKEACLEKVSLVSLLSFFFQGFQFCTLKEELRLKPLSLTRQITVQSK